MGCNDKITQRCKKVSAGCVNYEQQVNGTSSITDECISIEDTTVDIYAQLTTLFNSLNLNDLESCSELTLPTEKTVKNIFQFLIDTLCSQTSEILTLQETQATQAQEILDLQNNICS